MIEVELLQYMGQDIQIPNAARACTGRDRKTQDELDNRDERLISYLERNRHMTPFEHNSVTVVITCPIAIARQIMRYRTFSYNELSRRYTSRDVSFSLPTEWRTQDEQNKQGSKPGELLVSQEEITAAVVGFYVTSRELYEWLLSVGVCREQARFPLPVATETVFWMTGNLRNWAHFLNERLDHSAQKEIQEVAQKVHRILSALFPIGVKELVGEKA